MTSHRSTFFFMHGVSAFLFDLRKKKCYGKILFAVCMYFGQNSSKVHLKCSIAAAQHLFIDAVCSERSSRRLLLAYGSVLSAPAGA